MRDKNIYVFIFLFIITSSLLSGQIKNLSNSSEWSELPYVVVRPNGEVLVAWTEGQDNGNPINGTGIIVYRTYTGYSGWSSIKIAADGIVPSAMPQMDVDYKGDVHMAYMGSNGLNREIYYKVYSNGRWSTREKVYSSPKANSSWPRLKCDGGKVYVMWTHNHDPEIRHQDVWMTSKYIGGKWPTTAEAVCNTPKDVSIHSNFDVRNGNVCAAWMDDSHREGNWNIYYNEKINGIWKNPVRVKPSWNQYMPAIAWDDSGNVHLIFTDKGGPTYYMRKSGGKWSKSQRISTYGTSVTTMVDLKYAQGALHGVWRQWDKDGDCIYYGRGSVDGKWEEPVKVSNGGEGEYPILAVDPAGNVHVVWSDRGSKDNRDIFYAMAGTSGNYPIASFTATPENGDAPLSVRFDATESYDPDGKIVSYDWEFGDGENGSGRTITHVYQKDGAYYPKLTVTDNDGYTGSASRKIIVGSPPVASFMATPTSGSAPLNVEFDASSSSDPDGTIISYRWEFGDTKEGEGMITSHIYRKPGIYTAVLYVTDNNGLEDFTSMEITVGTPGPKASFEVSSRRGPAPFTVKFDASNSKSQGSSIIEYNWNFGDGSTGKGKIVSHTYKTPGTYRAVLTIKNAEGQTASASKQIGVYSSEPKAVFKATPLKGAVPLKVTFDASKSSDKDGKIVSYDWQFGNGAKGSGKKITHTYEKHGLYKAILTVTDNLGYTNSAYKEITALAPPKASFTFSPKEGVVPITVSFDASKSSDKDGTVVSYIWKFGDYTPYATGKTTSHKYRKDGTMTISLMVIDNDKLKDTTTKTITLIKYPYPPLNPTVTNIVNRSPFSVDYINLIEWQKNPKNKGKFNIIKYRIYRKKKGTPKSQFKPIYVVEAGTLAYEDKDVSSEEEMESYDYAVSCLARVGEVVRESPLKKAS